MRSRRFSWMSLALVLTVLFLGFPEGAGAQEFRISSNHSSSTSDTRPDVAFGVDQYFVVWEGRTIFYDPYPNATNNILGARVLTDGTVLDDGGVTLENGGQNIGYSKPAVCFGGTNFVLVYEKVDTYAMCMLSKVEGSIHIAQVTEAGGVVDSTSWQLSSRCSVYGYLDAPGIGFNGVDYLAFWFKQDNYQDDARVVGSVYTPGMGGSYLYISPHMTTRVDGGPQPAVAFDGTDSLVVWLEDRDPAGPGVYGARVTQDGTVLDPDSFRVSPEDVTAGSPAAAYGSPVYLVVWESGEVIYGTRVSTDGTVLDASGFVIGQGTSPAVSHDGTDFLVVWNGTTPEPAIHGAWVSPSGDAGMPFVVGGVGASAALPAVAFDGERFLVTFQKKVGVEYEIFGVFVGPEIDCTDDDGDGYGSPDCVGPSDCDDSDPNVNPGAEETCNGEDTNCNGVPDDVDADGDGYVDASCGGDDCDDSNPNVNPGAAEGPNDDSTCRDGLDNDCDGAADEEDSDCAPDYPPNSQAAVYGPCAVSGSGMFNQTLLILLPLGALVILRIHRRRKLFVRQD